MSYFFISGIAIALFLFAVLITKPAKEIPDYMLAILLLFFAQTILTTFLIHQQRYVRYPDAFVFSFASPLMVGPLLFLYTRYQTKALSFQKKDLLHALPYIAVSLLYAPFYFLSFPEKESIMKLDGKGYELIGGIRVICIYASGILYSGLSLRLLLSFKKKLKNEFSNTEKIQFNWLLFLILGMLGIWIIVLFMEDDRLISIASTLFVILLGYFGITQVNVFNRKQVSHTEGTRSEEVPGETDSGHVQDVSTTKYQNSGLNEKELLQIHEQLKLMLRDEKPYLNPELTLTELAGLVNAHPNKLSQAINQFEQKSFYDLINEMRIREFLERVMQPENKKYTFISLAYDCGFNSKASFNRNFKKYTDKTPSDYLKEQEHAGLE